MCLIKDLFSLKEARLLFFLMALHTPSWAQNDPQKPLKWREFRDSVGRFRVLVPTEPSTSTQDIVTPVGTLTNHQFSIKGSDTLNMAYGIGYYDYPKGTFPADSTDLIQTLLQETIENTRMALNGQLHYASDIALKQYPGKIWRIAFNQDKTLVKCKAFLVGDRFFLIHVLTAQDKSSNTASDKFLNSFSVF